MKNKNIEDKSMNKRMMFLQEVLRLAFRDWEVEDIKNRRNKNKNK